MAAVQHSMKALWQVQSLSV